MSVYCLLFGIIYCVSARGIEDWRTLKREIGKTYKNYTILYKYIAQGQGPKGTKF